MKTSMLSFRKILMTFQTRQLSKPNEIRQTQETF